MRTIRKFIKKLSLQYINLVVYEYNLQNIDAGVQPKIPVTIEVEKTKKAFSEKVHFTALHNNTVVNNSYMFTGNLLARQIGLKKIPLIGDCETSAEYRGLNIYPYVINRILQYCKEQGHKKAVIFVAPDNRSSIRGIEKSGFTYLYKVRVFRFLGIAMKVYKEYGV